MKLLGLRIFGEYEPTDDDRPHLLSILPPPITKIGDSHVHVKPLPRSFRPQPLSFVARARGIGRETRSPTIVPPYV